LQADMVVGAGSRAGRTSSERLAGRGVEASVEAQARPAEAAAAAQCKHGAPGVLVRRAPELGSWFPAEACRTSGRPGNILFSHLLDPHHQAAV
jgi:hypothetical protein